MSTCKDTLQYHIKEFIASLDIKRNSYYQSDSKMFNDLVKLIIDHPIQYSRILNKKGRKREPDVIPEYRYLNQWVNNVTAFKLSSPTIKTTTKCYWILNDLHDFPRCKECGNQKYFMTYNVNIFTGYPDFCSLKCIQNNSDVISKREDTILNRFGVKNPFQSSEVIHDCLQKKREKFGENFEGITAKIQATKKRHAEEDPDFYRKAQEKRAQTCLRKFGAINVTAAPEKRAQMSLKYKYDDRFFDSSPELALYIWLKEHNIEFEFQPCWIDFIHDGKVHRYFPDFRIDGKLIELKGDHFLKEDGTWQCIWNHNNDALYEAKRQCAIQNAVEIWYSKKYMQYVLYVERKHGKNFFEQHKYHKSK